MEPKQHPYEGNVSPGAIMGFARKNLPNFSSRLDDLGDVEKFLSRRPDVPYKVILFTKKESTTALFKGLTAEYRDRLELI